MTTYVKYTLDSSTNLWPFLPKSGQSWPVLALNMSYINRKSKDYVTCSGEQSWYLFWLKKSQKSNFTNLNYNLFEPVTITSSIQRLQIQTNWLLPSIASSHALCKCLITIHLRFTEFKRHKYQLNFHTSRL